MAAPIAARAGAADPGRFSARSAAPHRHACRLRAWRLRRVLDPLRRQADALLPDVRGAGRRRDDHHGRRAGAGTGRAERAAGLLLGDACAAMRLLHARHADRGAGAAQPENRAPSDEEIRDAIGGNLCRCTGYKQIIDAIKLAAARLAAPMRRREERARSWLRQASVTSRKKRRPKEDRRFIAGAGRFVADLALPACCMSRWSRAPIPSRAFAASMRRRRSRCRACRRWSPATSSPPRPMR